MRIRSEQCPRTLGASLLSRTRHELSVNILELAQSDTASLSDVAQSVKVDPALTLKILRIANSPIYGGRRESENLAQALSLLGLDATLTLALSFSLVNSLKNTNAEGFDLDAYWRRCLLAAAASQTIAQKYPADIRTIDSDSS